LSYVLSDLQLRIYTQEFHPKFYTMGYLFEDNTYMKLSTLLRDLYQWLVIQIGFIIKIRQDIYLIPSHAFYHWSGH